MTKKYGIEYIILYSAVFLVIGLLSGISIMIYAGSEIISHLDINNIDVNFNETELVLQMNKTFIPEMKELANRTGNKYWIEIIGTD